MQLYMNGFVAVVLFSAFWADTGKICIHIYGVKFILMTQARPSTNDKIDTYMNEWWTDKWTNEWTVVSNMNDGWTDEKISE